MKNARPTRPLRIGLIGAGGIAARHVAAYRALAGRAELVAVADPLPDRASAMAEPFGARTFRTYQDLLEHTDVDAVDICLPHHLHAPAVIAAARAGRHVLAEKPLCRSLEEAETLSAEVDAAGITMMCSHNRLFSPVARRARAVLAEHPFGRIYEVRATDCFRNEARPADLGWRTDARLSGGGELIDTGYHPAYLVLALAGGAPVAVTAMTSRHRLGFLDGEDSAQVLVRFDNGVVGHIATSWAYRPPESFEFFAVVAERGHLAATRTRLTYQIDDEPAVVLPFEKGDDIAGAVEHFVECLEQGRRPLHTHHEGAQTLGMITAAYESVRTSTVAPVALPRRIPAAA